VDLLITLIGNAAVDPEFREKFLDAPLKTADEYGFRLTKGEVELLTRVFTQRLKDKLAQNFKSLQDALYENLQEMCHRPPCLWSVYPPPKYRPKER
jgi:hypothetical protein